MVKFAVTYGRKIRTIPYESLNIEIYEEFDTDELNERAAFERLAKMADAWISEERNKIVAGFVPRNK